MTEALSIVWKTILFLAGLCVCLSLVAWIIAICTYIVYVTKE